MGEHISGYDKGASHESGSSPEKVDERELNKIAVVVVKPEASIVHLTERIGEVELEYAK